jgi:hypothetical protein
VEEVLDNIPVVDNTVVVLLVVVVVVVDNPAVVEVEDGTQDTLFHQVDTSSFHRLHGLVQDIRTWVDCIDAAAAAWSMLDTVMVAEHGIQLGLVDDVEHEHVVVGVGVADCASLLFLGWRAVHDDDSCPSCADS